MKHVSEYSGLDLGSLGEYIFPSDLAFVVYRNGTTMDLGNLSSLWRNAGTAMLGVGCASGPDRAEQAELAAVSAPLTKSPRSCSRSSGRKAAIRARWWNSAA